MPTRAYDYPQIHEHLEQDLIEDWVARKPKPGKPLDEIAAISAARL